MKIDEVLVGFVVVFLLGTSFICFILISISDRKVFKQEAVDKGHAEYHQTTGEWQWKEIE